VWIIQLEHPAGTSYLSFLETFYPFRLIRFAST